MAPDTLNLYGALDSASNEFDAIARDGADLGCKIGALMIEFGKRHRCDAAGAIEHVNDALSDLINDAQGPSYRRRVRLEDEIGALEDADMRRSSPVVL